MAKFNLHDFVMNTIHKMITSREVAEYKVMQYALNYYDKEILTDDDMEQIATWIAEEEAKIANEIAEQERLAEEIRLAEEKRLNEIDDYENDFKESYNELSE